MNSAPSMAGSTRPEEDSIFVCTGEYDADFFVRINNTGGPVDVWAIDGIDEELIEAGTGFFYVPHENTAASADPDQARHPAPPTAPGTARRLRLQRRWLHDDRRRRDSPTRQCRSKRP